MPRQSSVRWRCTRARTCDCAHSFPPASILFFSCSCFVYRTLQKHSPDCLTAPFATRLTAPFANRQEVRSGFHGAGAGSGQGNSAARREEEREVGGGGAFVIPDDILADQVRLALPSAYSFSSFHRLRICLRGNRFAATAPVSNETAKPLFRADGVCRPPSCLPTPYPAGASVWSQRGRVGTNNPLSQVISRLPVRSIGALASSSRRLRALSSDILLWAGKVHDIGGGTVDCCAPKVPICSTQRRDSVFLSGRKRRLSE